MAMTWWLPSWPRMRMPNRGVLTSMPAYETAFERGLEAESFPAETDPPVEKQELGKVEE